MEDGSADGGLVVKFSREVVSDSLATPWTVSPPGSSVHGILQARILEWVAMPSSRGVCPTRDQTCLSCLEDVVVIKCILSLHRIKHLLSASRECRTLGRDSSRTLRGKCCPCEGHGLSYKCPRQ